MKMFHALCALLIFSAAALATPVGNASDNDSAQTPDLPDNWDQAKDDTQSLFMNKNNKNDLEPYAMAISDDATNARYDSSSVQSDFDAAKSKSNEALDNIVMRPELYGEPPVMSQYDRLYNDIDRRKRGVINTPKKTGMARKRRSKPKTAVVRPKRESGMSSADVLTLLSLWEAQQRRNQERQYPSYYNPNNYYNINPGDDQGMTFDDLGEDSWLDEPSTPNGRFEDEYLRGHDDAEPYISYYPKESHFRPGIYQGEQNAGSNWDGARRKKQWVGFRNANRATKRFMVAKKRGGDPMQSYQKNYRPREDLYSLVELLRSSPDNLDQGVPLYRRNIL